MPIVSLGDAMSDFYLIKTQQCKKSFTKTEIFSIKHMDYGRKVSLML